MIELPAPWTRKEIAGLSPNTVAIWATPRGVAWLGGALAERVVGVDAPIAAGVETLIVVGGGTLIDAAKIRARPLRVRGVRLVAVPTLWGSGAEVSPIAVVRDGGARHVSVDRALVPDAFVHDPALLETLPLDRALDACADAWAHAIEGFASPLATRELRLALADVLREMTELPLGVDARWLRCSALACAGQARSSVGLVHGLAHAVEDAWPADEPPWGHARLVRTMLAPALDLDLCAPSWRALWSEFGLNVDALMGVARRLSAPADFGRVRAIVERAWPAILRDPSTRTNPVLVRRGDLDHFLRWSA